MAKDRDIKPETTAPSAEVRSHPSARNLNPAEVVLALAEVYRVSQPLGADSPRRKRYFDAALKAGDALAEVVLGPADLSPDVPV